MLTSKERFSRILNHQPVDRIGLFEVFWRETADKWTAEGHLSKPEDVSDHFGLDVRRTGGEITPGNYKLINVVAEVERPDLLVEETETTKTTRDGNGALLRWLKKGGGAPEHIGFDITERMDWEDKVLPRLLDEKTYDRRINFTSYRETRQKCTRDQRFMTCGVVGPFDVMSPMCGHENLLMGMAADPDWVRRMALTYADLSIRLLERLFAREGMPDGLWVWDDLGYRDTPFMSTAMYRDLIMPAHQRLFGFARSRGLPVVLHCDQNPPWAHQR